MIYCSYIIIYTSPRFVNRFSKKGWKAGAVFPQKSGLTQNRPAAGGFSPRLPGYQKGRRLLKRADRPHQPALRLRQFPGFCAFWPLPIFLKGIRRFFAALQAFALSLQEGCRAAKRQKKSPPFSKREAARREKAFLTAAAGGLTSGLHRTPRGRRRCISGACARRLSLPPRSSAPKAGPAPPLPLSASL